MPPPDEDPHPSFAARPAMSYLIPTLLPPLHLDQVTTIRETKKQHFTVGPICGCKVSSLSERREISEDGKCLTAGRSRCLLRGAEGADERDAALPPKGAARLPSRAEEGAGCRGVRRQNVEPAR